MPNLNSLNMAELRVIFNICSGSSSWPEGAKTKQDKVHHVRTVMMAKLATVSTNAHFITINYLALDDESTIPNMGTQTFFMFSTTSTFKDFKIQYGNKNLADTDFCILPGDVVRDTQGTEIGWNHPLQSIMDLNIYKKYYKVLIKLDTVIINGELVFLEREALLDNSIVLGRSVVRTVNEMRSSNLYIHWQNVLEIKVTRGEHTLLNDITPRQLDITKNTVLKVEITVATNQQGDSPMGKSAKPTTTTSRVTTTTTLRRPSGSQRSP